MCIFFLAACNDSSYTDDTRLLNNYLKECLHTSIPAKDTAYYVIISEDGCEGCISKTVASMKLNDKAKFIVSKKAFHRYIEGKDVNPDMCLIDSTNKVQRIKYHQHNVGIVKTTNNAIYDIQYLTYVNADSILATIK